MKHDDLERVKAIFDAARKLPTAEQEAYVNEACGEGKEARALAQRVLILLHDLDATELAFQGKTGGAGVLATGMIRDTARHGEGAGSLIGPYKLLEEIGEGGFGLVYMAQQEKPIRRRVALKIIKLGLETDQVIARFEQERQALAMMDHPHIAKVLDAGTTPTGRPYFVMELVRGEPITTFCDNKKLSVPQRLELFAKVCHAVQHAHQKGIIHRDLKPSNVLVTVGDGDTPVPKVIDFGIAKATQARLTEKTLFTEFRQMIGTPAYMSPEQAGMGAAGGLDIDTRSDVYALGALLYELLTGVTPFDAQRLRSAAFAELQRMIREDDPPKPSTRVSTEATIADVAARRQSDPKRLGLLVRGELDWVVMKCLEKDRTRRYATADDLARDLNRYLKQEPLEAGPPTAVYRVRKFVRRNKGKVVLAAALCGMLIVGVVGTSIGLVWAVQERSAAIAAREDEADARRLAEASEARALDAEAAANARAEEHHQISRTQAAMLSGFEPSKLGQMLRGDVQEAFLRAVSQGRVDNPGSSIDNASLEALLARVNFTDLAVKNLTRSVLDPGLKHIETSLAEQPIVQGRLLNAIGWSLYNLGRYGEAAVLMERAVAMLSDSAGRDHETTLLAMHRLGYIYRHDRRLFLAEPLWREVMDTRMLTLGPEHDLTMESVYTMGVLMSSLGRREEGAVYYRSVIEWSRSRPESRPRLRWALADLGISLTYMDRYDEAEVFTLEALEMRRADLGEDHRDTLWSLANLANLRLFQKRFEEAEALVRTAIDGRRRVLGDEHPLTIYAITGLALMCENQGLLDDALMLREEVYDACIRSVGSEHETTLEARRKLGTLLHRMERFEEAEVQLRAALVGLRRQAAAVPKDTGLRGALTDLNTLMRDRGNLEEAAAFGVEAMFVTRRELGDGHWGLYWHATEQARTLRQLGRFAEAEALFNDAEGLPIGGDRARFTALEQREERLAFLGEMIDLYEAWHAESPDAGHDASAAARRAARDALEATSVPQSEESALPSVLESFAEHWGG